MPPHNGLAWCRAGPVADTMTQAEPGVNSRPRDCVRAIVGAGVGALAGDFISGSRDR